MSCSVGPTWPLRCGEPITWSTWPRISSPWAPCRLASMTTKSSSSRVSCRQDSIPVHPSTSDQTTDSTTLDLQLYLQPIQRPQDSKWLIRFVDWLIAFALRLIDWWVSLDLLISWSLHVTKITNAKDFFLIPRKEQNRRGVTQLLQKAS